MKSRSPLKGRPHRVPGQSVDEERERLISDEVEQWLFLALFMVVIAGLEWYRYFSHMPPNPVVFTIGAVVASAFAGWRMWRVRPKARALRQARDGERVVGQFLENLRANGYRVFHDLVADGFNVDHLLIGPAGVFTVETKTWSKPAKGAAEIHFDGDRIKVLGREPERDPIVQARAQANWVKTLLNEGVGRTPYVKPVVLFPGWFIVNAKGAFNEVWVLEPKALPAFLANEPERLSESDIHLFAYHVSRHIRAEEAA